MSALRTTLDFSVANALRAGVLAAQDDAPERLRVLRRVRRQFVAGTLPQFNESNVEQSPSTRARVDLPTGNRLGISLNVQ